MAERYRLDGEGGLIVNKPLKPAGLRARARKIQLIGMDVDGVLTAGGIIVPDGGGEIKIWNVKDGMGFHLAHVCGQRLDFAWITGRKSRQVTQRAKEMRVKHVYQNCSRKAGALEKILRETGLHPEEAAYIGDDLNDLPVMRMVGLAACPSDAPAEVREGVHYVSPRAGGAGVARDVIELVLKSRGLWEAATRAYL